jgi:prepilin-type N-terminal cleavage/methylation domain-containing protein
MKKRKGFTLMEIMIVVAIVAALSISIITVVGNSVNTARQNSCRSNMKIILTAAERFKTDSATGVYPTTTSTTDGDFDGILDAIENDLGTYVQNIPNCPSTGGTYTLTLPAGTTVNAGISCSIHGVPQ